MKSHSNRLSRHLAACFIAALLATIISPDVLSPSLGVSVTAQDGLVSQSVSGKLFDGDRRQYYFQAYTFSDSFTLIDRVYMQNDKEDVVAEIVPITVSVDLSCPIETNAECIRVAQKRTLQTYAAYVNAVNACVDRTPSGSYSCILAAAAVLGDSSTGCGCTLAPDHY
jgi:hypothetical protein